MTRVLLDTSSYTDGVVQSPYYAGIIFGSLIWVGYSWATRLITRTSSYLSSGKAGTDYPPETESHPFAQFAFVVSFGLSSYNFFRSITLDPGFCSKPANDGELRAVNFFASLFLRPVIDYDTIRPLKSWRQKDD